MPQEKPSVLTLEDISPGEADDLRKISQADDISKKNIAIQIKHKFLDNAPTNAQELHDCVKALWGVSIPYTSCSPDANAPFEWFSKLYFGLSEYSVAVASRLSGKTFYASILHYLLNNYRPGFSSRHAAGTRDQADVAAMYLQDWATDAIKGSVFDGRPGKLSARWKKTGGHWKIVTGSAAGVSGQHPIMATFDEIEFWKIEAVEQTFFLPQEDTDGFMLWAAFSTRQRSFGCMNWLVDEAPKRSIHVFKWTAFETMQRCKTCVAKDAHPHGSDEQRQQVCNLWEDCRGEKGIKATGWIPRERVCMRKASLSKQAWRVQGICDKPSSTGLVLNNFEHEYKPDGNYTHWTYQDHLPLYVTHDPAEGKKSCLYFIQVFRDSVYVFDEIIQPECPNVSTTKGAFYERCEKKGYKNPTVIVVDPRKPDAIADWNSGSLEGTGAGKKYRAAAPDIDKASGGQLIWKTIEFLRKQIQDGDGIRRLFVNPVQCPGLVRGAREYHYPTDMNNQITSDTPDKEYSDEIDPLRYFVQYYLQHIKQGAGKAFWLTG
jgi:hypothetical protein